METLRLSSMAVTSKVNRTVILLLIFNAGCLSECNPFQPAYVSVSGQNLCPASCAGNLHTHQSRWSLYQSRCPKRSAQCLPVIPRGSYSAQGTPAIEILWQ